MFDKEVCTEVNYIQASSLTGDIELFGRKEVGGRMQRRGLGGGRVCRPLTDDDQMVRESEQLKIFV